MKVRIGLGLGELRPGDDVDALLDAMEGHRLDSLWLSEVVQAPLLDPVVAMAYVVARTRTLKVGTGVMVLPGRHPVLVAKQLASLVRLAPRRILPAFGLQPARASERGFFAIDGGPRGMVFDEALVLVRRLLTEERVTFQGEFFSVTDASVGFPPQHPLDLWLGGSAAPALRRIGRLADGWLASFVTPEEAAAGIGVIKQAAAEADRVVDQEHYGATIPVVFGRVPDSLLAVVRARRPDRDPGQLIPVGWDAASRLVAEFVAVGVSKFVVRPVVAPPAWPEFVEEFADRMLPLQD